MRHKRFGELVGIVEIGAKWCHIRQKENKSENAGHMKNNAHTYQDDMMQGTCRSTLRCHHPSN